MDSIHHDEILKQEAERIVQATRGMGKIHVEVLPPGEIAILVHSRAVKRQVEEVLGALGLQSPYEVYLRRTYSLPPHGPFLRDME